MGPGGAQAVEQRLQPVPLGEQRRLGAGRHALGPEAAVGLGLVLLGEEHRPVEGERLGPFGKVRRAHPLGLGGLQGVGELLVVGLAGAERRDQRGALLRTAPGTALEDRGLDPLGGFLGRQPQRPVQPTEGPLQAGGVADEAPRPHGRPDRRPQGVARGFRRDPREGGAQRRVAVRDGVGQDVGHLDVEQFPGLGLVEHHEAGRHVRLEGEHVEQPLAQGVQRLDLEAARRLDRPGEEAARQPQALGPGALAGEFGEFGGEGLVVQRHPATEEPEDADRHIGRRGLGEGQAEDPAGRRLVEEQPDHPVGEDLGLARAGIGRDPGRGARVGGPTLVGAGQVIDDEGGGGVRGGAAQRSGPARLPALSTTETRPRTRQGVTPGLAGLLPARRRPMDADDPSRAYRTRP
ncbi:hypothetical protein AU375_01887 [Methylobacterium radiotolerans]|nr:hypothetical protein AU375_01887 [Methylobacterium radiotolerans]